ncbi:hypothetical protein DFJ58DRAFT_782617 [Suillus subalutaceus]|uniref:uncharacterized protein n=1 Tax=Suillus subalutaceus TaxID=48586 RepID=UPI001B878332|nr:uncharacterized protein DFJ58DRAFT_782617 [Suillus subalutaceus]KAG1858043.1 hypothetical protein DFJ58DRAFT_782617 [Suillus subalutaceus]
MIPANHKTSNHIKPALLDLSPEDSTEKGPESTKSSAGKGEAPENTAVDDSTSNVWRVLDYLSKPHKNYMEFHGVRAREFGLVEQTLDETAQVLIKPRLTYDRNTRILIIDIPTILHEASFDDVSDFIGDSIKALPYDRTIISPKIHMMQSLDTPDGVVTPDMTISVTALEGPTEVVLIPFFGECALTETDEQVFRKTEKVILAHPDTICVMVVLAREATDYDAPGKDSTASKVLRGGTNGNPQPLTLKEFINLRTTPRSFGEPIVIGDHTWGHLSSVEYFIWVKGNDGPIDIRSEDPAHMAYGTLGPTLDMDAVTGMLERGLTKMKDSFVTFQKQIVPDLDCTVLAEARATSFTDWCGASKRIMSAPDFTAYERYLAWHKSFFDTTSDSDDATSQRKRASTSKLPSSRFKIPKATSD